MKSIDRTRAVLWVACATLFSSGASATPPPDDSVATRTETVKYLAAEAATPDGAAALYSRLQSAATRVCRDPLATSGRRMDDQTALAACRREALDRAVADLGIATVATLHSGMKAPADTAVARR
jgi:UrcA family protein